MGSLRGNHIQKKRTNRKKNNDCGRAGVAGIQVSLRINKLGNPTSLEVVDAWLDLR